MAKVLIAVGRSGVVLRAANRLSPLKVDIPESTTKTTSGEEIWVLKMRHSFKQRPISRHAWQTWA